MGKSGISEITSPKTDGQDHKSDRSINEGSSGHSKEDDDAKPQRQKYIVDTSERP